MKSRQTRLGAALGATMMALACQPASSQTPSGRVTVDNFPAVQPISGTVDVGNFPALSGNVSVSNFPTVQAISGTVAVGNLPAIQPVSGTVSVGNFPATQPISGAVNVSNFPTSINVGNLPAVQPVNGSVTVGNFPAVQPVTGTVTANPIPFGIFNQAIQLSGSTPPNAPLVLSSTGNLGPHAAMVNVDVLEIVTAPGASNCGSEPTITISLTNLPGGAVAYQLPFVPSTNFVSCLWDGSNSHASWRGGLPHPLWIPANTDYLVTVSQSFNTAQVIPVVVTLSLNGTNLN